MQLNYNKNNNRSNCSISCALEIVGDKWTLLIIRDIIIGKSRSFGEFRNSPEKIASNILSDRLDKMVSNGILNKKSNKENKLKFDYTLTKMGEELEPIIIAISKWGAQSIKGTISAQEQQQLMKRELDRELRS
jgi:DNA-binding HxlR family transcriptional regulator